jgi:serine/threonine-protein kinase
VIGTAFYLSPEQASGKPVTASSDVYSLGVVAYECLTGQRPFIGESAIGVALAHVRDQPPALCDVRPEVAALVLRMLAKDPADRPASAGELAREAHAQRATSSQPVAATLSMPAADETAPGPEATEVIATGQALPRSLQRRAGDTDPGFRLPSPGRTPRWVTYAGGLLAAVLVLLLVAHVLADGGSGTPEPKTSPTGPVTVLVRASDYVGKPATEASAALRALGLTVSERPVPAGPGTTIGTVTDVTPVGRLSADDPVTLEVARAPAGPPSEQAKDPKRNGSEPPGQQKKHDRKQDRP